MHFSGDVVLFCIIFLLSCYLLKLGFSENWYHLLISVLCILDLVASCFLSARLFSVHLEKWCVLKRGWRRSISGSQVEGRKIEETRKHQLEQLASSDASKVRLHLHKPLLAHHCRYRYGSVHALQIISPSLQDQFTLTSHFRDAHLYLRKQDEHITLSLKQTHFHGCAFNLHLYTADRGR